MDTPTHGLVGRLVARSIWPDEGGRGLVNLVTVTSMLPDVDVFLSSDALESLQTHRGMTHSLLGAALGAFAVAWVARRMGLRNVPFQKVYAVSLFGLLLHILFDLVTSYGTMIFTPFSNYRACFDVLFVIDPYLDLILIGGLLFGWGRQRDRAGGYRLGATVLAMYMGLNTAVTGVSLLHLDRWAGEQGLAMERVAAVPLPFSPLHRRGVVLSEGQWHDVPVSLFAGAGDAVEVYASALSDPRLSDLWAWRDGRIYQWFARFPVVTEAPEGDAAELLVRDLRFMIRPDGLGWLGALALEAAVDHNPEFMMRRNFSLLVKLDGEGRLVDVVYTGGSMDRTRQFNTHGRSAPRRETR